MFLIPNIVTGKANRSLGELMLEAVRRRELSDGLGLCLWVLMLDTDDPLMESAEHGLNLPDQISPTKISPSTLWKAAIPVVLPARSVLLMLV